MMRQIIIRPLSSSLSQRRGPLPASPLINNLDKCYRSRILTPHSSSIVNLSQDPEMENACGSDDRETPLIALQNLTSVISVLFEHKDRSCVRVYDPYFCKGGIISSLSLCGFNKDTIFNENKDCYAVQKKREVPENDMIITNPPYSGDHIRRALHYAECTGRPWAMLLPSYVLLRPWYCSEVRAAGVLLLCPHERYSFEAVQDVHTAADAKHVPFVTMWFIGGLSVEQKQRLSAVGSGPGATLASCAEELPRRVRKLLPFTTNKAIQHKKVKQKMKREKSKPSSPTESPQAQAQAGVRGRERHVCGGGAAAGPTATTASAGAAAAAAADSVREDRGPRQQPNNSKRRKMGC